MFQHTAARRRLHYAHARCCTNQPRFNTQPRGGGCFFLPLLFLLGHCFNTQPRGGGCPRWHCLALQYPCFNTQPRGGGCIEQFRAKVIIIVSTHSRAEAAANSSRVTPITGDVSTHSRAEAAACFGLLIDFEVISFNTQPRGGGCRRSDCTD